MLGFYNYTVVLTYCGMLTGFWGVTCAAGGDLRSALVCLMVSGLCDMLDGAVASTRARTAREKRFGIQIDSLSDLVCFGVLPALTVCRAVPGRAGVSAAAGLYLLCALIRLAYFNVEEEERQVGTSEARRAYRGLPVTSAALVFPALFSLCRWTGWPLRFAAPAVLLLMGAAFLTPFPLKKPAAAGKVGMAACGAAELALLVIRGVGI